MCSSTARPLRVASWRQDIATLDRASAHSIRFLINFKTGADDVKVFVDGKKLISDTTWEDYYRDAQRPARCHRSARCCSARAALQLPPRCGNGFLIDNLTLTSS